MLCSRFLRPPKSERHGHLYAVTERFFDACSIAIRGASTWVMRHRRATMILSGVMLLATIWMFYAIPKGFIPSEDNNNIIMFTLAQQGISFEAMKEHQLALAKMVSKEPAVEDFFASIGPGGPAAQQQRHPVLPSEAAQSASMSVDQLIDKWRPLANSIPGLQRFPAESAADSSRRAVHPQHVPVHHPESQHRRALSVRADSESKMRELKDLRGVNSDLQISNPQVNVEIDRDKARSLGVSAQAIEDALYDAYGSRQISTIYAPNDEYKVEMEVEPQYPGRPVHPVSTLCTIAQMAPLVPLSTVVKFVRGVGPLAINHSGQLPAVTISFDLAPGVSLAKGLDEVQKLARETLPASFTPAIKERRKPSKIR